MIKERSFEVKVLLRYAMITIDSCRNQDESIGDMQYELMITGMEVKIDRAIENGIINKQIRNGLLNAIINCNRKKVKELL